MWLNPAAYSDFIFGTYESTCYKKLTENLGVGLVGVDIGANLGYFSILMGRLVGESGRIFAFEPMPDTYESLCKNISLNHLSNTSTVNAAVSDKAGSIRLFTEPSAKLSKTASMVGYRLEGERGVTIVPSIRLDDYFSATSCLPSLIMMDVEGAELSVLNGARQLISRCRPILLVEIHAWGSAESRAVLDLLIDLGYVPDVFEIRGHEAFCLATPHKRMKEPKEQNDA
jgi:FkbM family methyltransferase